MNLLGAAYNRFLNLCGLLAGLAVTAMAVAITIEVAVRNVTGRSFPWLLESSEYALFVATFLGVPWVLRQGAHVRVDVLLNIGSPQMRRVVEIAANTIAAVTSLTIFYFAVAALII